MYPALKKKLNGDRHRRTEAVWATRSPQYDCTRAANTGTATRRQTLAITIATRAADSQVSGLPVTTRPPRISSG